MSSLVGSSFHLFPSCSHLPELLCICQDHKIQSQNLLYQSVLNPWPVIGGVATSICRDGEYTKSNGAQVGDVVVLTKNRKAKITDDVITSFVLVAGQWRKV